MEISGLHHVPIPFLPVHTKKEAWLDPALVYVRVYVQVCV